jgi:hypothetical protein
VVSNSLVVLPVVALGVALALAPALAQTKPAAADAAEAPNAPTEASLTVGALQIASVPNLEVAGFDISVATNSVTYSYYFKNTATADLAVTATVSLPELQASGDGSETWTLAATDPDNFIGLTIAAAGAQLLPTKAEIHAYALGIDRLAELKADHLPVIPFGADVDKALGALSPEAAGRLAALGIISPRDPENPKVPPRPDWTLSVVRSWRQVLTSGKTTAIVIKFVPVTAHYRMAKGDEQDLNDLKDEVCLKPQALGILQSRLKGNGAWNVTDVSLAADAPAHWIDSPPATLSVQKPKPDAIVAFCGMDDKTASKPAVLGAASNDNDKIHIVIFEAAK